MEKEVPPPAPPAPHGEQTPSADYSDQFDRVRQRSVRLVISIPVLNLLVVIGFAAFIYSYLTNYSQRRPVSGVVMTQVERKLQGEPELALLNADLFQAQQNVERMAAMILLSSVGISLVAAIMGYILALQIVRPIHELQETMESLAEGDFTTKVQPITLGEFGQLGMTFNRMVDQLNKLFEERDRQLRESFNAAHLVLDKEGIVLQADQAARRIFGLPAGELMGRNLLDAGSNIPMLRANPRFLSALVDLVPEALSGAASHRSVSVRSIDKRSSSRLLISCLQLESSEGHESQVLVEVRDISSIAGFYEQIQRADRLAAVGTLATGIAHEIRNPLASIHGMAQLLSESVADVQTEEAERTRNYCQRMLSEVNRLEKLVAGIRDFAHREESPVEDVNLNALLRETADAARMTVGVSAKECIIEWDLDETLPKAHLQVERLRQALLNLFINAYQHCVQTGKGPIRVQTLHLEVNPQRPLILCIANPCEPMDEAAKERLFEPFYTTKPNGTGLGLPITYQTVKANGGVLELEFENGEIQFWVRLPLDSTRQRTITRIVPIAGQLTPLPSRGGTEV